MHVREHMIQALQSESDDASASDPLELEGRENPP